MIPMSPEDWDSLQNEIKNNPAIHQVSPEVGEFFKILAKEMESEDLAFAILQTCFVLVERAITSTYEATEDVTRMLWMVAMTNPDSDMNEETAMEVASMVLVQFTAVLQERLKETSEMSGGDTHADALIAAINVMVADVGEVASTQKLKELHKEFHEFERVIKAKDN